MNEKERLERREKNDAIARSHLARLGHRAPIAEPVLKAPERQENSKVKAEDC
ncbi:MAG: hypothetical protein Q8L79_07690 [Methylobacter sp.]|uniref:hypothetical protein n=1 Tax=Methylobacter sp. TaxID=2051955 RepID=UPI00272FA89E|nr:hypothetical protein [Methylobacter sp.]MDP1664995.1 hypothetical protein [Methylobacter sp.]